MTLWDRVHHGGLPRGVDIAGAEAFDVSDVVKMVFQDPVDEYKYSWQELPNIAPPFERYFMFARPDYMRANGNVIDLPNEMGVFFEAKRSSLTGGWAVMARLVGGPSAFWQEACCAYSVDADGRIVTTTGGARFVVFGADWHAAQARGWSKDDVVDAVTGVLYPFVLATSILHCKNVTARRVTVPPKLARAQAKRGRPRYTYSVLEIEPLKKVLRAEGGMGAGNTFAQALHICRGHFKDYRDGKGLFGRHKGMYWWEQAIRGDPSVGVHDKDYTVRA
jgi:hypothetical protein